MFVAEPVIKMSINPISRDGMDRLAQGAAALPQGRPDVPRFHRRRDGETVIAGMGELHLEIYVERIRREYKVEVEVSPPKVSYREAPTSFLRISITSARSKRAVRANTVISRA